MKTIDGFVLLNGTNSMCSLIIEIVCPDGAYCA